MFGGDDLFGDLPSAKNDKQSKTDDTTSRHDKEPNVKKGTSEQSMLVSALGSAGTTMAFVPAALQRRKRQQTSLSPLKRVKQIQQQPKQQQKTLSHDNDSDRTDSNSNLKIHFYSNNSSDEKVEEMKEAQQVSEGDPSYYEESPKILALHTHVSTVLQVQEPHLIYDPHVPNDYLQFKEDESQKAYRAELEASAREAMEVQRIMQEQVERERAAIERGGNLDQIVASRNTGRGRGRGISNLPAWLVKKQEEQQKKESPSNDTIEKQNHDPRCIIVVENFFQSHTSDSLDNAQTDPDEQVVDFVTQLKQKGCQGIIDTKTHLMSSKLHIYFSSRNDAIIANEKLEEINNGPRKVKAYILDG